ncbi:E3 ubiquitin-protein ligase RHF1A isoform X1 [Sesamum indicum]|uniref:RING-type E3 ubiquitin transferase n=1 Tax=Sesamum indicum TaxID=4182 RepID=A0A6I9U2I6_SESIN|nr:E3 ubiquitin-protein ligase RHF1A isoform X1 [Sesamum indicum]
MNMASSLLSLSLSAPSSSSGPVHDMVSDDSFEYSCSICLEPFTSLDPPSVTKCNHEYHLHCILEWSQRSIECPICLQHLVLKDPVSQELLAGVGSDKIFRPRQNLNPVNPDNNDVNNDAPAVEESDFEQRIMRHFATIASRARSISSRQRRQTTPPVGPSQIHPSVPIMNVTEVNSSSSEHQNFSESLKSKISTASIRYKESISKSTRGLKEKLIARNDSVKELSRGMQREMSAGIAGISRMIDRLDIITQKRAGVSIPVSSCTLETSNNEVKGTEDEIIVHLTKQNTGETSKVLCSDSTQLITDSNSGGEELMMVK